MKRQMLVMVLVCMLSLTMAVPSFAMGGQKDKRAVVLASFGTSYPSALNGILNIREQIQKAFPGLEVRLAFTSNIIRNIWHERQKDKQFIGKHPDIPRDVLFVKGPLAAIAELQDEGYRTIIVQSTHIYDGEEYTDLCSYLRGLNSIRTIKAKYRPFEKLVAGRPALGKNGPEPDYHEDMAEAAKALRADVEMAKERGAALVYMGHGNETYSTGVYAEFQKVMRKTYPGVGIFVGTVEGFPSREDVLFSLKHAGIRKVILKPFMVVAGDHARNDMAGSEEDSWKSVFEREGIRVTCVIQGLGENPEWAKIYLRHMMDAARANGISL
ncbi:MAG: sirohydrochlorin cobaltochelatase [Deltaproteobacteria bacterium]|nr:sirohydrochlorin cobaltochelatase [Deltaproteobacteria bacterium]